MLRMRISTPGHLGFMFTMPPGTKTQRMIFIQIAQCSRQIFMATTVKYYVLANPFMDVGCVRVSTMHGLDLNQNKIVKQNVPFTSSLKERTFLDKTI